ncbi:MAG: Ig-like domain-containing protein [Proteobacteria bacterium]|nr:Ig-like domain-containing protein [Pseudomonadota bacterium]
MKEATKSANAPQITITAPTQGTVLSGSQTITWTATDADGDSLYYSVSFSSDNGATWVPLVFDTTTTSFSWNTASTVKNGTGCMIRVTATDGLNTSTKTVGSLTIANQPCIVYSSPSSGQQNVPLEATITMEFSDEMDEESITSETVTLEDGTGTRIPGSVSYDSTLRQALLVPQQTLTAAATYTVKVSSTVQNKSEFPLSGTTSFSFTTKSDVGPPQVVMVSPGTGALNIPINARVAVMFDEGIDSSTLTQDTFYVTSAAGTRQSDTINYSASTKTAVITFASDLSANSIYTATVKAGIKDAAGNTTQGDYTWSFQTGTGTISQLGFSGVYADQALDDTGDGLYDRLVIDVGVEVFTSGYYNLNGRLVDSAGQEIDWGTTSDVSIDAGVQVLQLSFKSDTIRSHGVNGPYSLKDLQFYSTSDPNLFVWKANAYTTRAYDVTKFNANLTLTGLPDVYLLTSQTRDNAFNLNDYALHKTLPDSQLTYEIEVATDSRCGVSIDGDDNIDISPQAGWEGYSDVTVKVTAGSDAARDTFRITVSNAPETTTTTTAAVVTTTTTTAPAGSTTTTSGAGSTTTTVSSGDCPPEYPVDCREQGSFGCCPADLPYCGLTKCYKTPPLCPMVLLADGDEDLLDTLRQFRNRVLYKTPAGKEYAQLFYQHAVETISILRRNPAALQKSLEMLQVIVPEIRAALQGEKISLDQPILNALAQVLEEIGKDARPVLKKDIARVAGRLKSGKIGILK